MEPWSSEEQPSQSLRPSRTLAFLPFGDRSQLISFLACPGMNWFLSLATSTFLSNLHLHSLLPFLPPALRPSPPSLQLITRHSLDNKTQQTPAGAFLSSHLGWLMLWSEPRTDSSCQDISNLAGVEGWGRLSLRHCHWFSASCSQKHSCYTGKSLSHRNGGAGWSFMQEPPTPHCLSSQLASSLLARS